MLGNALIGRKLGDYMIVEMLGHGGMAHVYKGYDANLDRYAAVKVITQQNLAAEDVQEYRERFQREARSIARLSHSRIVGVYQFGQTDDHLYYMAMKYIEGHDLRQILKEYNKRGKRMSSKHILQIVHDIADALDYAHLQGVIHRDVKPSNIMVMQDGHAVLTDFGLALTTTEGTIGNTFGSVHYIAPEQAVSSKQASPQSDLYSLGIVVYEMLTGKVPFDDISAMSVALKHISEAPPKLRDFSPEISPQIEEVVMKMLDKEPRRRYLTGASFVQSLEVAFQMSKLRGTGLDELALSRVKASAVAPQAGTPGATGMRATQATIPASPLLPPQHSVMPDTETVTDSSSSSKLRGDMRKAQSHTDSLGQLWKTSSDRLGRRGAMLLGGVVLAGVIGGFTLLAAVMTGSLVNNAAATTAAAATQTEIAQVQIAATQTAVQMNSEIIDGLSATADGLEVAYTQTAAVILAAATETAFATPEPSPTAAAATTITRRALTRTLTRTATRTPASTRTFTPTATPTATLTATLAATLTPAPPTATPTLSLQAGQGDPALLLRYDGRSLVIFNRQGENRVDISDLDFIGINQAGGEVRFSSNQWGSGNNNLYALRPGDCFQVWSMQISSLPVDDFPADICGFRQGFVQTPRTFWISEAQDAVFEVHFEDQRLATCPAAKPGSEIERRCAVPAAR
jgi:serine/threonine protein kinase